jgi:hypothetical protein
MRTDDFLADLEAQLRDARPRRDLRPLVAAAVGLALLVGVLAVVPRHRGGPRPAAGGPIPVAISNHTGRPEFVPRLGRGFVLKAVAQRAKAPGWRSFVAPVNGGTVAQARKLAAALDLPVKPPRRFPGNPAARVVISAGPDLVPGTAPVAVLNGTLSKGLATDTAARLRRAGYHVPTVANAPDQAQRVTTVTAVAPRYEATARALRRRLRAVAAPARAGAYRPLAPRAGVLVVLGRDRYEPVAGLPPRVLIDNGTSPAYGRAVAARLRAAGDTVVRLRQGRRRFRTRISSVNEGPVFDVAETLGLQGYVAPGASVSPTPAWDVAVELGSDIPGARVLERAIGLRRVSCMAATPQRRRVDPFGRTSDPTYVCTSPPNRVYDVRVLPNGSFVGERRGGGKAIHGSGARP